MLHIGGVIYPDDDHFIQPEPELKVPTEDWKIGTLNTRFFNIAEQFRCGRVTSAEITGVIDDLVERTVARWPV